MFPVIFHYLTDYFSQCQQKQARICFYPNYRVLLPIILKFKIMRTLYSLLFVFLFLVCPAAKAQDGSNSFMTQAQSSLEKKEYTKARYLFIQAYKAFADNGDYEQAIEAGTRASFLYYRENYYQEAFELCRKIS